MTKSKLVLGTAQLGMNYGLNNSSGQPPIDESFAILDTAFAPGINIFDTAHAYGNSEEVIGEWLEERGLSKDVRVISKLKPNVLDEHQGISVKEVVETELKKSLARLRLSYVDGYLLHTPKYLYVEGMIEALKVLKEKRLTTNIGVSIYDEEDALKAVDLGIDYIQVPYNALDQRLDKTDFFEKAKRAGVTVFARSPFLQGLLLMEPESIPPHLSHAREHVERFRAIGEKYNLSPLEASLIFVYQQPRIEHIVFGVEKLSQLTEGLEVIERLASTSREDFVAETKDVFQYIDRAVVNPSLWSKK